MAFKPRARERYSCSSFLSFLPLILLTLFQACLPRFCSLFWRFEIDCSFRSGIIISFYLFCILVSSSVYVQGRVQLSRHHPIEDRYYSEPSLGLILVAH